MTQELHDTAHALDVQELSQRRYNRQQKLYIIIILLLTNMLSIVISGGLTYYLNTTEIPQYEQMRVGKLVSGHTGPDRHKTQGVEDEQEKLDKLEVMPDLAIHITEKSETRNETSEETVIGGIYDWGR